jgi:uncharacterized protein YhhL (DUF1145 family)
MSSKILDVLFTIVSAVSLGYWLPHSESGIIMELIGITALVISISLPMGSGSPFPNEDSWLNKLRVILFGIGGILTLLSTTLGVNSADIVSFFRLLMVVCWWTIISSVLMRYSNSFNSFQLGIVIFVLTGIGLGIGYLGSIYFNLTINF